MDEIENALMLSDPLDGENRLTMAVQLGFLSVVKLLIKEYGYSPFYRRADGKNILDLAIQSKRRQMIRWIAKCMRLCDLSNGLLQASLGNNEKIASIMLKAGADPNIMTRDLLKWGAYIMHADYAEKTALTHAIAGSHQEVVELLLNYGAYPSKQDWKLAEELGHENIQETLRKSFPPKSENESY
jgi:ankyrin repeat protein